MYTSCIYAYEIHVREYEYESTSTSTSMHTRYETRRILGWAVGLFLLASSWKINFYLIMLHEILCITANRYMYM